MNIKNIKTKCTKQNTSKSEGICRTYSMIAEAYVNILEEDNDIITYTTNVLMANLEVGEYTTDFLCTKANGQQMIRECIDRTNLLRPKNALLLDYSRNYWKSRGIDNWGIVTNDKKDI